MRRKLRKRFKKAKRTGSWDEYHVLLPEYKKSINKAKSESWKKTLSDLNNVSHAARLHKLLSKSHMNKLGTLLKDDGTYTSNDAEILEELASSHFPGRSCERPRNSQR